MRMQITFKSGAQIVVDVDKFTTKESTVTGDLTGLHWTTPDDAKARLSFIADPTRIEAIVRLDD